MGGILTRHEALRMLESKCDDNVVAHCIAVSSLAVEIAEKIIDNDTPCNIDFIETASLLHDVGRSVTHGIRHGIEGAKIMKDHPEYALVCKRHIGGGIDSKEAMELGLPIEDYIPETLEEKIICYAVKLVSDTERITIDETLDKFRQLLGDDHPSIMQIRRLHEEITGLM